MFNNLSLSKLYKSSEKLSNQLSNFTISSSSKGDNFYNGLHNTRTSGRGEQFLQFKEFRQGDDTKNIDWRKSASTKKLLVKEKEKEISDRIYIHIDNSTSMLFKSKATLQNKFFISCLIALTLCRIFSKYREQVFLFNDKQIPIKCSYNINNFDKNFLKTFNHNLFPNISSFKENSLCIFISDFFYNKEQLVNLLNQLKKKSVNGLLLQILDPLELNFKLDGSFTLVDIETNKKLLFENIKSLEKQYSYNLKKLRLEILEVCKKNKFTFLQHCTNNNLDNFLLKIIKNILINKK